MFSIRVIIRFDYSYKKLLARNVIRTWIQYVFCWILRRFPQFCEAFCYISVVCWQSNYFVNLLLDLCYKLFQPVESCSWAGVIIFKLVKLFTVYNNIWNRHSIKNVCEILASFRLWLNDDRVFHPLLQWPCWIEQIAVLSGDMWWRLSFR